MVVEENLEWSEMEKLAGNMVLWIYAVELAGEIPEFDLMAARQLRSG